MKFALDTNHLEFFEKNQYIEFASLLTENEIKEVQIHLDEALWQRAHLPKKRGSLTAENLFMLGHDVSRHHPYLRKIATKKVWAEIASQLVQRKTLRFGYDQLFPGLAPPSSPPTESSYAKLARSQTTLTQLGSIQEVMCGLMLCIKNSNPPASPNPRVAFPVQQGHGIFIQPRISIPFAELSQNPDSLYLLIAYVSDSAVYILNEQDPHVHFLKSLDYTFGDKLKEKTHPILIR